MAETLLNIKGLHATVAERDEDKGEILKGIDLKIDKGEIHVIMGPNGSGKSTLMNVIMGHPKYQVTNGSIEFEEKDLLSLKTFERARQGIFLSFQNNYMNRKKRYSRIFLNIFIFFTLIRIINCSFTIKIIYFF